MPKIYGVTFMTPPEHKNTILASLRQDGTEISSRFLVLACGAGDSQIEYHEEAGLAWRDRKQPYLHRY